MQIIVDDLLISYQQEGDGKPILLLHGWGDSAQTWHDLQNALANNFRVITVNLPGFGGSQAPKTAWGLDEYAQFVSHFLQKLNVTLYATIGHSNGGAIAITGLGNSYLKSERLILLGSAGVRNQQKGKKAILRYATKAAKIATKPLPIGIRRTMRRKAYGVIGSDMFVAEHLEGSFRKVVGADVQAIAAKVMQPVLLIYGEQDTATPVLYGELLHSSMQSSRLEIIGGAGHFVHHDKPQQVLRLIRDFL